MALFNEPEKGIRSGHVQDPSQPLTIQAQGDHAASPRQTPPASREAGTYLNPGTKVNGKVTFEAQARIDGHVEGEILAKDALEIGESAVIAAPIGAVSIIVAGTVKGELTAVHRIEIRPSARVQGNVTTPRLVVHEGAMFEGHCAMPSEVAREDRKVTVLPKEAVLPKEERKMAQATGQKQG